MLLPILLMTAYLGWNSFQTVETGFSDKIPADAKAFVLCPNQGLGRALVHHLLNSTRLFVTDLNNPQTFNMTAVGLVRRRRDE